MALSTPTIDALLGKRITSKEKMEHNANGDVVSIIAGRRRRYDSILSDIGTLEKLKDTSFQINEYGLERWNNDFIRVSQLPGGAKNERWKKIQGTRFARFQMAFCHPNDWVVHRLERTNLDNCSLKGTLVRGDWMNDEFAHDVGFVSDDELDHFKGDPMGRIAMKQNLTEHLKALHESTVRIGGSRRMLRIEPRSERTAKEYANIPEHDASSHGSIVALRENVNGSDDREMIQMYFADSGSMLRKTLHQEHAHIAETEFLETCQTELEGLNLDLDLRYRKGTPEEEKKELWEKSQATIARFNDRLLKCFNQKKTEAAEFLLDASDLEDSTGKRNISRAMTKITGARGRLAKRHPQMKAIEKYNMEDRQTMYAQTRREELTLRRFRRIVTAATQRMEDERAAGKAGANDFARRTIQAAAKQLPSVLLRPTRGPAETLGKQAWSLGESTEADLDEQLLILHVTGKLQGLRTSFDWMRLDCAQARRLDAPHALAFITNVEKAFMEEQVLPGKRVLWLEELLAPFVIELQRMKTRLRHYVAHPPTLEEEKAVCEAFGDYLESIDLNNAINAVDERVFESKFTTENFVLTIR